MGEGKKRGSNDQRRVEKVREGENGLVVMEEVSGTGTSLVGGRRANQKSGGNFLLSSVRRER